MLAMLVRAARFESMPGLQPMPVSRVVLVPQYGMPMRVTVRDGADNESLEESRLTNFGA